MRYISGIVQVHGSRMLNTGSWSFWTDIKLSLVLCCFISIKWRCVLVTTFCLFIFCLYLPDGVRLQKINSFKKYFHTLNLLQKKQLPPTTKFNEDNDCSPSFKGTFIFFWRNDLKSYLSGGWHVGSFLLKKQLNLG